jgi:hypothetical protein
MTGWSEMLQEEGHELQCECASDRCGIMEVCMRSPWLCLEDSISSRYKFAGRGRYSAGLIMPRLNSKMRLKMETMIACA